MSNKIAAVVWWLSLFKEQKQIHFSYSIQAALKSKVVSIFSKEFNKTLLSYQFSTHFLKTKYCH